MRSLNFLSVPIFVAFKSPSPARRRVMLDLIVGARKKQANACNALLHHLAFSLHQSGQRCLFITFESYMEGSRVEWSRVLRIERCTEKYHHRRENIGVKLIAGTTASSFRMSCLFPGKLDNAGMFDCYNQFFLFLVHCS